MAHTERSSMIVGERGRIVLPAELRSRLGIQPGDRLIVTVDETGDAHLVTARELAHRLYGMFRDIAPGRSLVDELIAERHAEAERESVE